MELFSGSGLMGLAGFGVGAGLLLLARGLVGYRTLIRVADTSTSTITSLAAGEVRVSGVIEGAELTLVSLLQRVPCVYYRSTIGHAGDSRSDPAYAPSAPIHDQAVTAEATSAAVRSLFAVVERYPEIKSQGNVQDLQHEIERLEGMIADRRELYNDQVYRYNTRIAQVPGVLLAPIFGWRLREFFAVDPAEVVRPETDLGTT